MPTDDFKEAPEMDGRLEIERDGFTLRASLQHDSDHGAPWDEEDGHGPVSDWRKRDYAGHYPKAPGEVLLVDDGRSLYTSRARFYDMQAAQKLALAEGWDAEPYNTGQETKRQQAAKAARADFERLRAWCNDQWTYVGVIVTAHKDGIELGSASLWGIESGAGDYLKDVANELIDEELDGARATLARLCECEAA